MVAGAAALALVLGLGGTRAAVYLPVYAVVLVAAGLELVLAWLGRVQLPWTWIYPVLAAILLLPLLQIAAGTTVDRAATETAFLHLLAPAAIFFMVASDQEDAKFQADLLRWAALTAGLVAALAIAQRLYAPHEIYGVFRIDYALPLGPFINRDDFAAFVELLLPATLALILLEDRLAAIGVWFCCAALALAGAVLSASRAGAAVIVLELLLMGWWWLRWRGRLRRRRHSWPRWVWLALAAGFGLFVWGVGLGTLLGRLSASGSDQQLRWPLVAASLRMAAAHPWVGVGLGGWGAAYPYFARLDNGLIAEFAHCDYAQWLAEAGAAGVMAAVAVLVMTIKSWRGTRWSPAATLWGIAVVGIGAHALLDFPFHIPALAALTAVAAAAALGDPFKHEPRRH